MKHINFICDGPIWSILLARPEKRNALNSVMVGEIYKALQEAATNVSCKGVIIKAQGKAFCAGADLAYLQDLQQFSFEENKADSLQLASLFKRMHSFPKLLITQVEGPALAGGCGIATISDFCFATPEATFGYTEARIGFIPAIVMVFLIEKIGTQKAREMMLSADIFEAETARNIGLVYKIIDGEEIDKKVFEFAQKLISRNAASSITLIKEMMLEIPDYSLDEAIEYAAEMNAKARESDDCKKGIAAFLDKTKPTWL